MDGISSVKMLKNHILFFIFFSTALHKISVVIMRASVCAVFKYASFSMVLLCHQG